jgi:hypothetical protein
MKSDGNDQKKTVAKTAEYPFERLALRRGGVSKGANDIWEFL